MLVRFVCCLVKCITHVLFRIKVHGKEHFPAEGAVIVAINHKSFWDAPLVAAELPRQLAFMAKKELFSIPVLGAIIKWAGAFPVSRGTGDLGAIKAALAALKAGKVMAIFPEGTRVKGDQTHSAKAGVALIAEKTGAPIVPVAIRGGYGLFSKIDVFIEEPMLVKSDDGKKLSSEELQAISDELMIKILHLANDDFTFIKENETFGH